MSPRAEQSRIASATSHRLYGRVQGQQIALFAATGEGVSTGIMPDVGPVSTEPAELDIVTVTVAPMFEDEDESHAGCGRASPSRH